MAEAPFRIPLLHQAVANLLASVTCDLVENANFEMVIAQLADLAPQAEMTGNRMVDRVTAAARVLAEAAPNRRQRLIDADAPHAGSYVWTRAMIEASAALSAFFFWRAAMAVDALSPPRTPAPEVSDAT